MNNREIRSTFKNLLDGKTCAVHIYNWRSVPLKNKAEFPCINLSTTEESIETVCWSPLLTRRKVKLFITINDLSDISSCDRVEQLSDEVERIISLHRFEELEVCLEKIDYFVESETVQPLTVCNMQYSVSLYKDVEAEQDFERLKEATMEVWGV